MPSTERTERTERTGSTESPGQVAIVTGASSGIGYATALHLAERGLRVFAIVRSEESAADLLQEAGARGLTVELGLADLRDTDSVRRALGAAITAAGRLDLLVNSAGVPATGVLEDTTPQEYHAVFDVNVCGMVRCAQAVLPTMRRQGHGAIVNVSSSAGRVAVIAQSAYVASKWALEGVTEALAQELAYFGIRVAIVEPGVTRSRIFAKESHLPDRGGPYDAHYRRMLRYYKRAVPQASPAEEVAEAIWQAAFSDTAVFRHACSWGGRDTIEGRARMSDEEWVSMNATESDSDYYAAFLDHFGISLA